MVHPSADEQIHWALVGLLSAPTFLLQPTSLLQILSDFIVKHRGVFTTNTKDAFENIKQVHDIVFSSYDACTQPDPEGDQTPFQAQASLCCYPRHRVDSIYSFMHTDCPPDLVHAQRAIRQMLMQDTLLFTP